MNCIITGGAGFIGSHLADRLLAEGHHVIALDNFITGAKANIAHLTENSNFQFIEHDCTKPLPVDIAGELVFHFASPASPPKYQKYPVETFLVNTIGTYHVLKYAHLKNARVVFASTSEVYGDPLVHPQTESYWGNVNPNGERSCYDEGKRGGEAIAATFMRTFQMDVRMVRIFNTYGPRMDIDDGRVVTNFIKQILHGEPITIYGDGNQTRSFCYVSDLVEGIYQVSQNPAAKNEVINLGNPHEQTIAEFGIFLAKLAGVSASSVHKPLPADDPKRRCPDISKAKQLLKWEPRVSLEEGLTKTLAYFKTIPQQ